MDNKIWAKTLLDSYEKLNCMVNNSERQINATVRNMGHQGGNALKQFDRLIKQIAHKELYKHTLKLIDSVLVKMDKKETIIMRHLQNKSYRLISMQTNKSLRTVFRKYDAEVELFAKILDRLGYNFDKCRELWWDVKHFRAAYEKIENNELAYSKTPLITVCMDVEKQNENVELYNCGQCNGRLDKFNVKH